ncbi:MAG: hypothetical protein C4567_05625 [Deltaproteobacteria bacterium]|nr:MAG: hypothetical protein C4567_05625 [Deltaproteobacteria bacterium]
MRRNQKTWGQTIFFVGDILGIKKDKIVLELKAITTDNKGNCYIKEDIKKIETFLINNDTIVYVNEDKEGSVNNLKIGDRVLLRADSQSLIRQLWKATAVVDGSPYFGKIEIK